MKEILKYHYYNLTRLNIATYKMPAEYIGMFLFIILISTVFIGMNSESPIDYEGARIINFNKLAMFYFIAPLCIDIYIFKFYDPNYQYSKILYPFKLSKIILIDFFIEFLSYKFILILSFIIMYIPFCNSYELKMFHKDSFIEGFALLIIMYSNSCLLIRIVKDSLKNSDFNINSNHFKLFLIIVFIVLLINENTNFMALNSYKTTQIFLIFALVLICFLINFLYCLNLKNDKN